MQDTCPEEFRSWEEHSKAFYASSLLQNGPMEEQQAYLNMCLDLMLETAMSSKIDPHLPIFQDKNNQEENYLSNIWRTYS